MAILMKLAYRLHMIICSLAFFKVVMEPGECLPTALLTGMDAGRMPHPFTSLFR